MWRTVTAVLRAVWGLCDAIPSPGGEAKCSGTDAQPSPQVLPPGCPTASLGRDMAFRGLSSQVPLASCSGAPRTLPHCHHHLVTCSPGQAA